MWADLAVFDEVTVADRATYEAPHAAAQGFRYVLVNGEVVVEEGRHVGTRPGRILLGPGATPSASPEATAAPAPGR
jgi:N-acyl-D-amino-acid deacylase